MKNMKIVLYLICGQILHLSRKTIHLLKQNKDYKINHVFNMNPILHTNDVLDVLAYEHDDGTYAPDFQI